MTTPVQESVTPNGAQDGDREGDSSLEHSWTFMRGVLDEAFAAVRAARMRNSEMAQAVENSRRVAAELEERGDELRASAEQAKQDAEAAHDTILALRQDFRVLREKYGKACALNLAFEDAMKHARRVEERVRLVVDAICALDEQTARIHAHYSNEVDAQVTRSDELNLARDEAMQRIRRAVRGLHFRADPKREPAPVSQ
jgi:hypothetical protein